MSWDPEDVVSDDFLLNYMLEFARQYGFNHVTSSPYNPQCKGEAERAVKAVRLQEVYWRSQKIIIWHSLHTEAPLCSVDSAQLNSYEQKPLHHSLYGIRTESSKNIVYLSDLEKDCHIKERQRQSYDQHDRAKEMSLLEPGDTV